MSRRTRSYSPDAIKKLPQVATVNGIAIHFDAEYEIFVAQLGPHHNSQIVARKALSEVKRQAARQGVSVTLTTVSQAHYFESSTSMPFKPQDVAFVGIESVKRQGRLYPVTAYRRQDGNLVDGYQADAIKLPNPELSAELLQVDEEWQEEVRRYRDTIKALVERWNAAVSRFETITPERFEELRLAALTARETSEGAVSFEITDEEGNSTEA